MKTTGSATFTLDSADKTLAWNHYHQRNPRKLGDTVTVRAIEDIPRRLLRILSR